MVSIKDWWNKEERRTKIIIVVLSVFAVLLIAGIYVSSHNTTSTYNDKLIKAHEAGASEASLISEVENYTNSLEEYSISRKNADIALVNYDFEQGKIDAASKEKELNRINLKYQTELSTLESIKGFQIAYIKGLISSEELKKSTDPLYDQIN
jgi:hypothetical protein